LIRELFNSAVSAVQFIQCRMGFSGDTYPVLERSGKEYMMTDARYYP